MVTHLKKKKRKQACPAQEPPLAKKQAGNCSKKDTNSTALEPVVNATARKAALKQDLHDLLQKKILKLTKKIGQTTQPAKKAVLQTKLLKWLAALADQENEQEASSAAEVVEKQSPAAQAAPYSYSKRASAVLYAAPRTAADVAKHASRAERFCGSDATEPAGEMKLVEAREQGQLWGTSTQLEKEYLRLTTHPSASAVRPPDVLQKALKLVKSRWVQDGDYRHAWQQLKAIRQDLTVQHVEGALAVDAYETHARIAIEVGDWAEFQQCQSVLQRLHMTEVVGSPAEFAAYAVLHAASHGGAILHRELSRLPEALVAEPCVQHAISVIRAYRSYDYCWLLQLYASAPRMTPYLMDALLGRLRPGALKSMVTAYHPQALPIAFVGLQLGMEDPLQVMAYCEGHGCVTDRSARTLDTKASRSRPAGPQLP